MTFQQQHGAAGPMNADGPSFGLFVKSLSKCTTERHLLALFSPFGIVRDIQVSAGCGARKRNGRLWLDPEWHTPSRPPSIDA
jgi:hypothetical protein